MSNLTITNLGKSFGSHIALRDISIDVASGEVICLLGGSGCGRTTPLRLIAGLETHDKDALLLNGKDQTQVPIHKRNIGMVFQSLALFPHLNVGENVAYGMRLAGVNKQEAGRRVTDLLDMVGLSGLADRSVAVRPEAISLTHSDTGLHGTITRQRRLGPLIERETLVGGKTIYQSEFANQSQTIEDGAAVTVSWAPDNAWALPG